MNDLHRELAPISREAWSEIEAEATRTLRLYLAARKLFGAEGPKGWQMSAVSLGRSEPLRLASAPQPEVETRLRRVQPLVELRVPFQLEREELDAVSRGEEAPDLESVTEAARKLALAEDNAVFNGWKEASIAGVCSDSRHEQVSLSADYTHYPQAVTQAQERLRQAGVSGPYALALGPRCYAGLAETVGDGGYPVLRHVQRLVDGPVVWAPAVQGAALLSLRGGDFQLVVGRDPAIGYASHDEEQVTLYLEESFTFRLLGPDAAVPLVYEESGH